MAALGMLIARYLVLPLRSAPPLNTLLITLMLGTVLREMVRLFYRKAPTETVPALLPTDSITSASSTCGSTTPSCSPPASRSSSGCGFCSTVPSSVSPSARWRRMKRPRERWHQLHRHCADHVRDRVGAGRHRWRDERPLLQRNQFRHGLLLGVIGFSAAIIGGSAASTAPFWAASFSRRCRPSAPSRCVRQRLQGRVCLHLVIELMAWRPTGLIQKKSASGSERMPEIKQEPRAPLLPGAVAVALSTVYLIALLAVEGSARHWPAGIRRRRRARRPLHGLARSGKPKFCRARGYAQRIRDPRRLRGGGVLHDNHFVLLLFVTVLLYAVATLGLISNSAMPACLTSRVRRSSASAPIPRRCSLPTQPCPTFLSS